jgi:adenylate kinase
MTHVPVVAVFGISGVGKSWMIGRYIDHHPALHVQASQLLRESKAAVSGKNVSAEDLRKGAVLDNQSLLIEAFTRLRVTAKRPILFDGHCVVDNGEQLIAIPGEVIDGLAIMSIVFVEGSAREIAQRRRDDTARVRPTRSTEELYQYQQRAKAICQTYHETLGLTLTIIAAGDEAAFAMALKASFAN